MREESKVFDYINRVTGFSVINQEKPINKSGLAFILTGSFNMTSIRIDSNDFVLLYPVSGIEFTGGIFVKRLSLIQRSLGIPCLLCLDKINPDMRRTLVSNHINFVIPDRQLSLPSMLLFMTERGLAMKKQFNETLTPAAQFILFYHLIKNSLDGLKLKDIPEKVGYGLKTVSGSISELVKAEICEIEQPDKRTKVVRFHKSNKTIWDEIQPKLASPIVNTYYIDSVSLLSGAPVCYSYDSALTRNTMITAPTQETYALEKSNPLVKSLQERGELHIGEGNVKLEIWKYCPSLLATDSIVDPLSLWMCYREEDDERVDGELGRLIDKSLKGC